jgi:hypothetical protein
MTTTATMAMTIAAIRDGNGKDRCREGEGRDLFVKSNMGSRKTLGYLLPIVQCLASSADNGRRPSPQRRRRGGRRGPQFRGDAVLPPVPHARTGDADALVRRPTVLIFFPLDSPWVPLGGGESQV